MAEDVKKPLFTDIDADEVPAVTAVESLCVECERNGTTKMLLTRIPFFKEIIVMSFECPHCGYTNNEVQSAGKIQEKGCIFKLQVSSPEVLNRQLVKSDAASFSIPELEFESQPFSQKGELNTIEGLLEKAISGLEQGQAVRKIIDPDIATKIDCIIVQLTKCRSGEMKFTFVLNDCSGNSFIENPEAPGADPLLTVTNFERNSEQDAQLGLQPVSTDSGEQDQEDKEDEGEDEQNIKDEVLGFSTNCPSCNAPAETKMKVVNIPHFKEVIIMATTCDSCGHRTNEVKSGSGIEEKGTRMTLRITDPSDLNRDVLKSETCQVKIPSLQLETLAETLGGRFTTLEGLLTNLKEQIQNLNPFGLGDSPAFSAEQLQGFLAKLDKIIKGEQMDVEIVLDDPAGNSYMQNLYAPDPDPELEIVHYDRTKEQEDELGISDMKTEGYLEDS